eukprot:sb/3475011/
MSRYRQGRDTKIWYPDYFLTLNTIEASISIYSANILLFVRKHGTPLLLKGISTGLAAHPHLSVASPGLISKTNVKPICFDINHNYVIYSRLAGIVESISKSYPPNCSSFCYICLEPRHFFTNCFHRGVISI